MKKYKVTVFLKPNILDPEGKTIKESVHHLGYTEITDIRVGKTFIITVNTNEDYKAKLEKLTDELLSNPVIHTFSIEEII